MPNDPLPAPTMLRTFLAIELPAEIKEALGRIQNRLRNLLGGGRSIRWTRPESIHLTLQFFGEIPSENIELITAVVKKNMANFAPFMLNLGSLGAFPAVTRPRVLYLGLEGQTDRLCRLQQQITTDLQELGFEKEERAFTAHLTLGRTRPGAHKTDLATAFQKFGKLPEGGFTVTDLKLFRSELRPEGPVYTVMKNFEFGVSGSEFGV